MDFMYNAGANDDASGLVSILAAEKDLKQIDPKRTVHFVAYDLEEFYYSYYEEHFYDVYHSGELSLAGSSRYVGDTVNEVREREGEEANIGNIHSDMVGYEEGDLDLDIMGCEGADPIGEAILRASEEIGSPFAVTSSNECRDYSDHKHFWDAGLPAVLMIDSTEPDDYSWYHEPGDTIDKVNIPYLRSVIRLNTAAAALLTADPES